MRWTFVTALAIAFAFAASASALTLRGVDTQNLPPLRLAKDSNVRWSAPEGGDSNFIFSTSKDLIVNALGPSSGRSFIEKGRHTSVQVIATGPWTITISAATPRPVRRSYTFTGVDGMNLAPFRVPRGSRVTWSAPQGGNDNFIFSTDQDLIVNALGPTHGKSFIAAGYYTGVSVTAGGPWTIKIIGP